MSSLVKGLKQTFGTKVIRGSKTYFVFINFLYFINKYFKFTRTTMNWIFYKLPNKKLVIKNSVGKFAVNSNDDTIPHSSPIFEDKYHDWLKEENPKNFLDIGGNVGFYTILALNKYKYKSAITFEANSQINKILKKNLSLNNLTPKVQVFNIALGDEVKKIKFKVNKFRTGLSSTKWRGNTKFDSEVYSEIEVNLEIFDNIVKQNNINVVDISFIKIDVEGAELQVLRGMKKSLTQFKKGTKIFIELLSKNEENDEILLILKNNHFKKIKQNGRNFLFEKIK